MTDRVSIKLDDEGQIVVTDEDGIIDFQLVEDTEELIQALRIRLGTSQGEDRFDPGFGLPIVSVILDNVSDVILGNLVRAQILEEPGVLSVRSVEVFIEDKDRTNGIVSVKGNVTADTNHQLEFTTRIV